MSLLPQTAMLYAIMGPRKHGHFRALALVAISSLVVESSFAIADGESDEDLLALARKHFDSASIMSEQERKAFEAFFQNVQQGNETNLAPPGQNVPDALQGDQWGIDRTIKAKWIVWLCKDPIASKRIAARGIGIIGAKIDGKVDLSWLKMQFPLQANACVFTKCLILRGASLRGLNLADTYIKGPDINDSDLEAVNGDGLTVEGNVNFRAVNAGQPVSLRNATIAGSLLSSDAHYLGNVLYIFVRGASLDLSGAKIGSHVNVNGARALGGVRFDNAKIDGDVIVGKDVGEDNIGSNSGEILSFFAANIGGAVELNGAVSLGTTILDLRDAKARVLSNAEKEWPKPGKLRLQGFVFNELGDNASLDAKTQIKWLRLQDPFVAQPYEQMATVFLNMGYQEEGVDISIAENWDAGWTTVKNGFGSIVSTSKAIGRDVVLWRYGKVFVHGWECIQVVVRLFLYDILWYWFFGPVIGYGCRPWNALFISFAFVFIGTVIFRFAAESNILVRKDSSPALDRRGGRQRLRRPDRNFSALIYSLETFVPLVKLGVAEYWLIDANVVKPVQFGKVTLRSPGLLVLRYYWTHIIAGWVFTSLWVAAFAGILKH